MTDDLWVPRNEAELFGSIFSGVCTHALMGIEGRLKGCGKTWAALGLINKALTLFPGNCYVYTNIAIGDVYRITRDFRGDIHYETRLNMPKNVMYVNEFGHMMRDIAWKKQNPENRYKLFLAVIDEMPTWLSNLESTTDDALWVGKIMILSRKFGLCLMGIGPNYAEFEKRMKTHVNCWWWKSLDQFMEIHKMRQVPDGLKLSVETHIILEAHVPKKGDIFMPFHVGENPWSKEHPRIGDNIYDTDRPTSFWVMEELTDKDTSKEFFGIISDESQTIDELYGNVYQFLDELIKSSDPTNNPESIRAAAKRAYQTFRRLHPGMNDPITIKLVKNASENPRYPGECHASRRESMIDHKLLEQIFNTDDSTLRGWDEEFQKKSVRKQPVDV